MSKVNKQSDKDDNIIDISALLVIQLIGCCTGYSVMAYSHRTLAARSVDSKNEKKAGTGYDSRQTNRQDKSQMPFQLVGTRLYGALLIDLCCYFGVQNDCDYRVVAAVLCH